MARNPSSKERIKQFLRDRVGRIVTARQLQKAAKATEWARRVRELRNKEGWKILTHNDDNNLKPGEYRLAETPPQPGTYSFTRSISTRIRAQVLERNGYTCQMCGAGAGESDNRNPNRKIKLHIGHIIDKSHGGTDDPSNLRALCNICNQGAKNLVQEPPRWTWLLSQLRRASLSDQKKALEWLNRKFEKKNNKST